jgi:hypothetical protein
VTKTETIEEFLARGGQKVVLPTVAPSFKQKVMSVSSTNSIMSLDEGAHYFSEFKVDKKTLKKKKKMSDFSALPAHLRLLVGL